MNQKIFLLISSYILLFSLPVLADQCSYISKEQALTSLSRLNVGQTLYLFCEPCGEKFPTSTVIESLSTATVGYQDFWQVKVNKKGIDLAYTFVESGIDNYLLNLAAIAGCPAKEVSPVLPSINIQRDWIN